MTPPAAHTLQPESPEERVLWHCIVWTYGVYLLGALYVLAPVVGWLLLIMLARRDGLARLPSAVWVWAAGMGVMLLALGVAHADLGIGLAPTLKSAVGWAKGWALIPVFMALGCGRVRMALLARAACLLGVQTLLLLPFVVLAWAAGLPQQLYVSPVEIVGGPGPEYFAVELYGVSPDNGLPRWRLFAPWAPAIGLVMCVYVLLAWNETDSRWRFAGIAGMLLAILLSSSRLGLLALPAALGLSWLLRRGLQPAVCYGAAALALPVAVFAESIQDLVEQAARSFHGARADSSRVRALLGRLAVERWRDEAPVWGHGTIERGSHLAEFMPIGTHHTWFGLLFVKGLVGAAALALPMLWTLISLLRKSARETANGRTALALLLLLFLYTFAENLEILAYLYWPALVAIGIALREAASAARRADLPSLPTPEAAW